MANDIKIRLVSELHPQGFNKAVAGMKQVETAYTATTNKILANAKGNVPKMVKAYKAILESGMTDAPKYAGQYFQNWANALIYNFTGGDSAKLKATLQKAIAEITNIGGEDNLAFINMTELNKNIAEVASMYDEASTGIESASRRKQAMYEKEVAVLRKLGLQQEEYNLTMQNAKEQMLALSPSMRNYDSEMERLSAEYTKAKTNLQQLTEEQSRASKGGLGQYVGTVVKGMLVHQAIAKAIQTVKQVLKESSQAAAEAEQRYNKLDTVFEGFTKTARDLTSTLASAIGVANSTAASALTTVGDLLQAQGMGVAQSLEVASDWVKRFQDIINFKDINESLDTFSSNIMAGFLGNTRNLRSIGVVIKDSAVKAELAKRNLDKLTGSELELAKMNIRAEMTFKQLENAMGATEREWDTNLAVNRRLNEAWKEYRETLGESINSVLKPMKSMWTEIITEINKANKAQKEYEAGNKDISVYDIHNNEKDARRFSQTISDIGTSYSTRMRYAGQNVRGYVMESAESVTQNILDQLNKQMIIFNATLEDVQNELGDKLTPEMYAYLEALEDERKAEIQRIKDIERRTGILANANDSFEKFQESLLGITGVNFVASDFTGALERASGSEGATNSILGQMSVWSANNIKSAIASIASADLSVWGDVISGELEGLDIPQLFEKKMASVADLFSVVWNEYLKDGVIDDEEKKKLEDIKSLYASLGIELDNYNAQLERQKNLTSSLQSIQERSADYQKQYEQFGLSSDEKSLDDLNRDFNALMENLGLTGEKYDALVTKYHTDRESMTEEELESYKTLTAEARQLNSAHAREAFWLKQLQIITAENERKEKVRNAQLEAQNKILDIQRSISQLTMTDEEKALDDLRLAHKEQIANLKLTDSELLEMNNAYEEQRRALITLHSLTADYNAQLEREAQIKGHQESATDYRTQLANLGKSDAEITRNGLLADLYNARWNGDEDSELATSIEEEIKAFDLLQEKTKELAEAEARAAGWASLRSNAMSSIGTVGSAINTFTDGKGDIWSDILTVLLEIFQKSKYWEDVVNIINRIIEPLLPLVNMIAYTLKNLEPVFNLIAHIIGAISLVVASILGAVNYVIDFFEWAWDWLKTAFHNLGEVIAHPLNKQARDIEALPKLSDYTKQTTEELNKTYDEILGSLEHIESNTAKDNSALLEAYTKMRDNQMITATEYDALVAGLNGVKYDRVNTYNGTSWNNGTGGTTLVYTGDMKFTIDGTNLSADEIAEAVIRKQQQWATTGQYH